MNTSRKIAESKSRLTQKQVERVRELVAIGLSQRTIANRLGVSQSCISNIVTGQHYGWATDGA
jgi:DNA-binding NarL/FixJ family response regulator